jgi:lipoprotein-releasing system permease protein
MNIALISSIAKSLLLARWKQTLVAAVGVTFSITMFIALLSFMAGLNDLLDGIMLNRTAHVRLYNEIQPNVHQPINTFNDTLKQYNFIRSVKSGNLREQIYNGAAIIKTLQKDSRVLGIAPKLITPIFFNNIAIDIAGVINGIDIQNEATLFHFNDFLIEGQSADLDKISNSIIIGVRLAKILSVNVGDRVQVSTISGDIFQLKVIGLYKTGVQDIDKTQSYASIATVQKLMGKPNTYITDIQIKLKNLSMAPSIAKEYALLFEIDAVDIQTANAQFETGSSVRTLISYAVGVVLLIVAGFGIYNILNMMIYEKMDTIAILKATGFSGKDVQSIFLVIAVSIGVFGGLLGLLLGLGLSAVIDQIPFISDALPQVKTYPINYNPIFYLIGAVFSLITTFFAGWFPARKASKVDPVIIIRGK